MFVNQRQVQADFTMGTFCKIQNHFVIKKKYDNSKDGTKVCDSSGGRLVFNVVGLDDTKH